MELIEGIIERITYRDEHFYVMQCSVRGKRDLQTITGKASAASVGEIIKAQGEWSLHHSHGMQFVASQIQTFPPQTPEGIIRYLSACIKGLGPVYAKRCVDAFGTRILEILDHSPDLLSSVRGLSERKIQDITTSWNERRSVRDIMIFPPNLNLTMSKNFMLHGTYYQSQLTYQ